VLFRNFAAIIDASPFTMEVVRVNFPPCYLFQDLNDGRLNQILSMCQEIKVKKDQSIFTEGKEASALYILKEGAVELMTRIEDVVDLPIAILRNQGDCFGTSALIPPHVYSLSARCVEEGSLLVLQQSDFQRLAEKDHEMGCIFMRNLAKHYLERLKQTRQELKIHFRTLFRSVHS
jgi:CRP/FNR family transcriptional regulator